MSYEVELDSIDIRYEHFRMRSAAAEQHLIVSIMKQGIREPLRGVEEGGRPVLLDGFKRYRCARKLGIGMVQYEGMGKELPEGILELLRQSNAKGLSMLEQARMVDMLHRECGMSISDIGRYLEKSKAWVSIRAGMIAQMSERIIEKLFSGAFPVYSYLYTLGPFIRLNRIPKGEVETFVDSVSGKGLTIREINILAQGYFRGGTVIREQIERGNISWGLRCLQESKEGESGCSEVERALVHDLEIVQKYMQRIVYKGWDNRYRSGAFFVQVNLLVEGIARQMEPFQEAIKEFHDKSGQAGGGILSS
jgi:hypothetical protein